jgi:hypothetical protein
VDADRAHGFAGKAQPSLPEPIVDLDDEPTVRIGASNNATNDALNPLEVLEVVT